MAINSITRTRINGLSSGMDTEALVKSMLQYDMAKVTKQFQLKTKMEWKRDAYREINTALMDFRKSYMSLLNPTDNMLTTSAYATYKVNMLTTTNAVTVSVGSNATEGKITINEITQLATAATAKGTGKVFGDSAVAYDTALSELPFANELVFEDDQISFSINGEEFTFGKEDTLSTMISTINANSKAGVRVSFSSLTNGFTIAAKTTGQSSKVEIVNIKGNAFAQGDSAFGIEEDIYKGENAKLIIENVPVERESNTFTIDGITYTLKDEMKDASASFSVERDLDATLSKITKFIDSYNELIGKLQSQLDEKIHYSYSPLTDDQRREITEDEAKEWDKQAKSGVLRNDINVSGLLNTLRSAFYAGISGLDKSAAEIGLTTGAWSDKGKIVIDEAKLRKALEENPDEVANLFTKPSSAEDASQKFNESGLIMRISNAMNNYVEQVTKVSLANLDLSISRASDRLTDLEIRMAENEEKYWARITAMETAMASLNSQSSWLTAQLSSLG